MKILTLTFGNSEEKLDSTWLKKEKPVFQQEIIDDLKICYDTVNYKILINDKYELIEEQKMFLTRYCSVKISVEEDLNSSTLISPFLDNLQIESPNSFFRRKAYTTSYLNKEISHDSLEFLYRGLPPLQSSQFDSQNSFLESSSESKLQKHNLVEINSQIINEKTLEKQSFLHFNDHVNFFKKFKNLIIKKVSKK